jgi:hypothetical protein
MTRRTLFAFLLAPFAPKPNLPSLTSVGPFNSYSDDEWSEIRRRMREINDYHVRLFTERNL